MPTTRLSSQGQVVIPRSIRAVRQWQPGQEFEVQETDEGILLRPRRPFPKTELDDVAGCLRHEGPPVPVEDISGAVALRRRPAAGREPSS